MQSNFESFLIVAAIALVGATFVAMIPDRCFRHPAQRRTCAWLTLLVLPIGLLVTCGVVLGNVLSKKD